LIKYFHYKDFPHLPLNLLQFI